MFEQQAIELSAQAGSMVGVEKEERLSTPWKRSLLFRHPWLQLNLLTAFVAAAVVGLFEDTLDKIVILAVFGGIWLDRILGTKPLFTISLVLVSAPLALVLTYWIARRAVKDIHPGSAAQPKPEQSQRGEDR